MNLRIALLGMLALLSAPALAATTFGGGNSQITATIPDSCTIVSVTNLTFGNYNSVTTHRTTPLDTVATMSVRCTAGSEGVKVLLQKGNGLDASCADEATARSMRLGTTASYLNYNIYQDVARTVEWGCGDNALVTPAFVYSTIPQTVSFYGRVLPGQFTTPGAYTDVVQVQVVF